MSEEINDLIESQIQNSPVLIYMKGSPYAPSCGFSARIAEIFLKHQLDFFYVNILENPSIHKALPDHSCWPTFPQIFINGELIGGCDIVCQIDQSGELLKIIKKQKLSQNKQIKDAMQETSI